MRGSRWYSCVVAAIGIATLKRLQSIKVAGVPVRNVVKSRSAVAQSSIVRVSDLVAGRGGLCT